MMLMSLVLNWMLLWSIDGMKLNLYNTDSTLDHQNLQVNCLHYYAASHPHLLEQTNYCLGSISNNYSLNDDFLHLHGKILTFEQLNQMNISTNDLLSWSAPIDLAEQYQYYLDHQDNSPLSTEIFFNCTNPWFGSRCQFSFRPSEIYWFNDYIRRIMYERIENKYPYSITNLSCYTHLECDRGRSGMCLDWREICNGRIDCIDGGADEAECFDLEINECNEDEYRCQNGQCIPKEFFKGNTYECLDRSDLFSDTGLFGVHPYISEHEQYTCPLGSKQFVCGDRECVEDFDECRNKKHLLLIESIIIQGDLSYICWITMICLTKIRDQINETSCQQFFNSFDINILLENCNDDPIQFPTVPILFGHVRFLFDRKEIKNWDINLILLPDYICYDDQLCDFLLPTYRYRNFSCRHLYEFNLDWTIKYKTWSSFIHEIQSYFHKCSIRYNNYQIKKTSHYSSLYCCKNSSKCISKHRILDDISDCYLNDDEDEQQQQPFELNDSIDDPRHLKCPKETFNYSLDAWAGLCLPPILNTFNEIDFGQFCDRQIHTYPVIIDGQNHTDETECEHWPCNNFYTRCDGFWSCPNGEDEENCTQQICPLHSLPCINPHNYTLTCLSANQVGNGHTDCLGAIDEREHCRKLVFLNFFLLLVDDFKFGFRCSNDDTCLVPSKLCNGYPDCPREDDEIFCKNYHNDKGICEGIDLVNRTDIENAICSTVNMIKIEFSLTTSPIYPSSDDKSIEVIDQRSIKQRTISRLITNELDDYKWLWGCNHGLYAKHWLGGNKYSYACFCSPSYYGDQCQYQNQRVTITIKVRAMDTRTPYAILMSLIDDNDDQQQIISYQQYTVVFNDNCKKTFLAYLTYSTRPKKSSANYSVRIDAYNKTNVTYLASWHFTVRFSFLPVNRMAVILNIPTQQVHTVSNCLLICQNGKCMKYVNKDMYYCQCYTGWSGIRCDISIFRNDCASNSTYVGMIYNRSICVCPVDKGGPRCLLTFPCNVPASYDERRDRCVVVDDGTSQYGRVDICSKNFSGEFCFYRINRCEISFHNIKVSPVLLIYTFLFGKDVNQRAVKTGVLVQKLTIFQRNVSVPILGDFNMVLVRSDNNYYLAFLHHTPQANASTSIDTDRRCASITELWNSEQLARPKIRRVKYYHQICQTHYNIKCFIDDPYMCLCTQEHHANCFRFDNTSPKCQDKLYCLNGGICLQDEIDCPATLMCDCNDCYFGDRCQFYAKGIGLILDDILRYELRPNVTLSDQSSIIKWSCALTMIIFVAGLINSILSLLTFSTKKSREVGCGIYLIASSITSLLTMTIFAAKFWFLIITHIDSSVSQSILRGGCITFEFLLKSCLYMDNWFNACVAIERAMTVYKNVSFNKNLSKHIAKYISFILPLIIMASIIHEPINRNLYDDKHEQRLWCVFYYDPAIQIYNTIIIFIHFLGPLCVNIFSALFIIFGGARRRIITHKHLTYKQHLYAQFSEHKNLFISPTILTILAIPGLIISISSDCVKSSYNTWLYLWGYFISFIPSMTIFIVFVLPSKFYKEQFQEAIKFRR